MSLKEKIADDIKQAMRAGEKPRLQTLRMLMAAIRQREIDDRAELDDDQTQVVVERMVRQRRESIAQYTRGGRPELAAAEEEEIAVLQAYLPAQLSDEEVAAVVDEALAESGASDMSAMGQVMGLLKPRLQGRADMSKVSALVRSRLAG
ncbi:MAG TPA: GatB/YqeY domain-containing protein [Wenzhouxiangella sp.]|nr:GatB/YqeY domain-containing protein [Wenzhouxiangella sp.]